MTDEQILQTAREVGWNTEHRATNDYIVRLAKAIAAHEREACAKVCEELGKEAELASGIPPTRFTAAAKTLREHAVAHYTTARYIRKRDDQRTI